MSRDSSIDVASFAVRLGNCFNISSLCVVAVTVAALPWFLGGAIPHAKLILQLGAVVSSVFAILSQLLRQELITQLPMTSLPLLGMCFIGVLQLVPLYQHPALEMKNAVRFELSSQLPATQAGLTSGPVNIRSVMPAETRQAVGQLVSMALLVIAVFGTAKRVNHVVIVLGILVLSGCVMTALALSQQFGATKMIIGNHWKVSNTTPFGCFVNPNNAAGWLMICLACAMFLAGMAFRFQGQQQIQSSRHWATFGDRLWQGWIGFVGRVADATTTQIISVSVVILLIAGVVATLSRAGIVAAVMGMIAFAVSRFWTGRWIGAVLSLVIIFVLSCLFVVVIDLDTVVVSELKTLKDPVSESTGRLLHWSDSLMSVCDFPLLGSGLGAYRFASLPYQRHFTDHWFQRADNQYVEVLVESGLVGFACLCSFGIIAIGLIRRVFVNKNRRGGLESDATSWLGSAVVFTGVAIASAAFFDYGISLPSLASAVVVLMALLERQVFTNSRTGRRKNSDQAESASSPIQTALKVTTLSVWIALIASSVVLIPDTLAAVRVYETMAPVERLLSRPSAVTLMESGDDLLGALEVALSTRPDDLQAERSRVLFLGLMLRCEMLRQLTADREQLPRELEKAFHLLDSLKLADQLLDQKIPKQIRSQVQLQVADCLKKYPFQKACERLLRRSAFVLTVGTQLAACDIVLGKPEASLSVINHVRFAEPHSAGRLYFLGGCMLRLGRLSDCQSLWMQSVAASESFRPRIMEEVSRSQGVDAAMDWFLPNSYESCVRCAIGIRVDESLRERLFAKANELWMSQPARRKTEKIVMARAQHLEAIERADEAVLFLEEALAEEPYNFVLRKTRAMMLERVGKNAEAYDEWLRIQSFHPGEAEIPTALDRLIRLPP